MGRLSAFESRMDRIMDEVAGAMFKAPLNPVQITKRAEKEMFKEKLVSAGKQYAPTLYNVLVNPEDDAKLSGFYPTLAGEIETYLKGRAGENGLFMDGSPLVRFIEDPGLRKGKFDVIAENVAAQIVVQLRQEEMERYGLSAAAPHGRAARRPAPARQEAAYQDSLQQNGGYRDAAYNDDYQDEPYLDDDYSDGAYADAYGADDYDDGYRDGSYQNERRRESAAAELYGDPFAQPSPAAYATPLPSAFQDGYADYDGRQGLSRQNQGEQRHVPTTRVFEHKPSILFNPETGAVFTLKGSRMILGRDKSCDISVRDSNVSRSHAELVFDGSTWAIRDLGSTNGTFVHGREVSKAALKDGDMITVGITNLEFQKG